MKIFKATTPEGVFQKIRESRYFLKMMAGLQSTQQAEEFGFILSAFMSAFRSVRFRFFGIIEARHGRAAARKQDDELLGVDAIFFLAEQSNVEVHGDGPRIFRRFEVSRVPSARRGRTSRFAGRAQSKWPHSHGLTIKELDSWQFWDKPGDLVKVCERAIDELEKAVRASLTPKTAA